MRLALMVAASLIVMAGIGSAQTQPADTMQHHMMPMNVERAMAVVNPSPGNTVHGTVSFAVTGAGVHVVADLDGLSPGKHGFHVHEFGDCSAPDAMSAGGHFNPEHMQHGAAMDMQRHAGDLGNLEADKNGHAHLDWTDPMLALSGPHSIIGRAVVVHASEDDLKTQPAGNSGARIGCGVIGIAK